jgi:hypothetical protein
MSKESLGRRSRVLALTALAAGSIFLLVYATRMDAPYIAFFLVASTWAFAVAALSRPEYLRSGGLLCSSALFSLAVVEACVYYATKSQMIITRTSPAVWRRPNALDIGSLPLPNTATEFSEYLDGRMVVDVTYRIGGNGLRTIPIVVRGRPHKIAFFGCSFMFGHGVENDQTLPYYFIQDARGTFEGYNFAGGGWGPHQMLREIETGFVRRVAGAPELAIYEAIPDHLRRVAGRAPWEDGPEYVLCAEDKACYSGPFHSADYTIYHRWLDRSWTVKFIENHFGKLSQLSDIPLYLAVLERTRSLLQKNGTRLVIVLWDQNELARTMMKALRSDQFDVIALSSVIPKSDSQGHPLTQIDRHPSPATNKAIAAYLWKQVGERLIGGTITG